MPRKKKKNMKKEEKSEVVEIKRKPGVPLEVYFAIKGIKEHRQPGMKFYKEAFEKNMTVKEWEEFFKNY